MEIPVGPFITDIAWISETRVAIAGVSVGTQIYDIEASHTPMVTFPFNGQTRIDFNSAGNVIAVSVYENVIELWDIENQTKLDEMRGHSDAISDLAFIDDRTLVSTSLDGTIRIWDTEAGTELHRLNNNQEQVWYLSVARDQQLIATGGSDGTLYLWDSETGYQLDREEDIPGLVVFSPDGLWLLNQTGLSGGVFKLSVQQLLEESALEKPAPLFTMSGSSNISFSIDGSVLALGDTRHNILLVETDTGQELMSISGHQDNVTLLAFSPRGRYLASYAGGEDGTLRIWEISKTQ